METERRHVDLPGISNVSWLLCERAVKKDYANDDDSGSDDDNEADKLIGSLIHRVHALL